MENKKQQLNDLHNLKKIIEEQEIIILEQNQKIIEQEKIIDFYKKMAYTDELTGCLTRLYFYTHFNDDKWILENYTHPEKLVIAEVDINNLKTINDTYGHQAGDEYIREIVNELSMYGTVFRVGGDEFIILIEDANTIPKSCKEYSVGIVQKGKKSIENTIALADKLMYREKLRIKKETKTNKTSETNEK